MAAAPHPEGAEHPVRVEEGRVPQAGTTSTSSQRSPIKLNELGTVIDRFKLFANLCDTCFLDNAISKSRDKSTSNRVAGSSDSRENQVLPRELDGSIQ